MIEVVVVESSPTKRAAVRKILESDPGNRVVGEASEFNTALEVVHSAQPDVVLLDIDMPGISGLDILSEIMGCCPTPTIILSSELGAEDSIAAFRYGCLDCIAMPEQPEDIAEELLALVEVAASTEVKSCFPAKAHDTVDVPAHADKVVVITASTGGPSAIESILKTFPAEFPCGILVVQHLPPTFTKTFAKRLDRVCRLSVKEAEDGSAIEPGLVLIAPGGRNVSVAEKEGQLRLQLDEKEPPLGIRPSMDAALESVASVCGSRSVAVILTGMGKDGMLGARAVRKYGGKTIVQDKSTSCVYGIPREVAEDRNADFIVPLFNISEKIVELL
jgi:two-component system chemotaxis response regulator CheB